jgi:hypothetical protein
MGGGFELRQEKGSFPPFEETITELSINTYSVLLAGFFLLTLSPSPRWGEGKEKNQFAGLNALLYTY